MLTLFGWIIAALSLFATILNVKKIKVCFYIWTVTNISWFIIDMIAGLYSQASLMAIYACLAVWGIFAWRKDV